jgi:CDP-diglyceride synthetase
LISAYESGDFIVGSGSANAFEGPLAGLVSLGAVAFLLFLIQPAPFDSFTILLFAALAAVCCPLGQILASGLLPRGNAWAPALRRLDSYLLAAPIWLILVLQL